MQHLVLEDEVPDALEALIATVAEETGLSRSDIFSAQDIVPTAEP